MPARIRHLYHLLLGIGLLVVNVAAVADPVSTIPYRSFAGNLDFVVTGGTLRTQPKSGNSCAVTNSNSAALAGIPATATIRAAYLYWAGSGPNMDDSITLNGVPVLADRTFTETYAVGGFNLAFFSGFEDVTTQVAAQRNGTYTFADLTVTNTDLGAGQSYCSSSAVLSGWGLMVVYDDDAEPLRVLNLFDGFEYFRGSQIQLTPSNFSIPPSAIDGKIGVLSWEGDVENSAPLGGVTENLVFDAQSTPPVFLTDGFNPVNNQYNSTINGLGSNTTYGVDFDTYDISSRLTAGDTTAQTTYASGGDLVLLSAQIISVTNNPVADLTITKSHTGNFSAGQQNTFNLTAINTGPLPDTSPITITDTVQAPMVFVSATSTDSNWSCTAAGQTVTCVHPGPLAAGASHADVLLTVDVPLSAVPSVSNTATAASPMFDHILANNSASDVATVVIPDLTTSSKTVTDLNGGDAEAGDVLRYTITLNETAGGSVTGVSVTDVLDPLLENMSIVNAGGGTDNSTPGTGPVDITDITVPAGGSTIIEFDAQIAATALTGDVIANTAVITNSADGTVTNATAPIVTVGLSAAPGSGIKNLYFGDIQGSTNNPTLPMLMSRVPLTVPSAPVLRARIRRQDNNRIWQLTPPLQTAFGIDAEPIPVVLQMRRNNSTATRNVRVSLDYTGAATGFVGCQTLSIPGTGAAGLSNTATRAFTFNIQRTDAACNPIAAAPLNLPAGTIIRAAVDNEPIVGPSGNAIYVYPFNDSTPDTSRVELPATTIINVDSIGTFDAAYPAGVAQPFYPPGSNVFIRAVVSDPFGSFDITASNIQLLDPGATPVAAGAMTEVDSTTSTKTYEFAFAIPGAGPNGNWQIRVTADEGTEGTITDLGISTLVVGNGATIVLGKTVAAVLDPVTGPVNPKSIPGATMEYVITATNTGPLATDIDTVVVGDLLPTGVTLLFGSPIDPVAFADGPVASGLSYVFTSVADGGDDLAFSNDGGATFITPIVDPSGLDLTSPPINYIEVTPSGTFNAPSGGDPSFTLTFRARLE
jgi:fimbrial isopeptide formation D2 family protein/uncharacterized repeat protein (TIGR01451 family)